MYHLVTQQFDTEPYPTVYMYVYAFLFSLLYDDTSLSILCSALRAHSYTTTLSHTIHASSAQAV